MSDIAISVSNVSKCYRVFDDQHSRLLHAIWPTHTRGMQEVWAIKDISFEIRRGESVAIIGRNGGGKSTLLEILTGTLTPTTGSVKVNGRVSALLELGSGFNPEYSGRDNVVLNGLLLGLSKEVILSRFDEIEAFAEIGAAIDRPVKTYSSGMVMRLAFAVQVLCDPDILIIDEALSVGDFFFQQKCLSYIRNLCSKGVTLLFVSHDMGIVRDLCARAVYLRSGSLAWDGEVTAVIQYYLTQGAGRAINNKYAISILEQPPSVETTTVISASDVLWRAEVDDVKVTKILSVTLESVEGQSIQAVRIGEIIRFMVQYQANEVEPVHISVTFKNRFDQVVSSTNSLALGLSMPGSTSSNTKTCIFELEMNLEAGQYSVMVNLCHLGGKPNQGIVLDETTWFGPIEVKWDYVTNTAPFLGMFGIPARAILK